MVKNNSVTVYSASRFYKECLICGKTFSSRCSRQSYKMFDLHMKHVHDNKVVLSPLHVFNNIQKCHK